MVTGSERQAMSHQRAGTRFAVGGVASVVAGRSYLVPAVPVEFHCHSMGRADFSDFERLDLEQVESDAASEGILCVPTLYLPWDQFPAFGDFLQDYAAARRRGRLRHIPGLALEGPLLASPGGTPATGVWAPSKAEWERLASWGAAGLLYNVLSPDAELPGSKLEMPVNGPSVTWIVSLLLEAGVRPALGHFTKQHPDRSAAAVRSIIALSSRSSTRVVTDHLFNDMPLRIRHAWRTDADRQRRDVELAALALDRWTLDNFGELVGDVPAAIVRGAAEGVLDVCLNFDGEHVDLDICRRVVELVGSASMIAMTDRSDTNRVGGQDLKQRPDGGLWYQDKGVVAVGSQAIDRQMHNMRRIGLDENDIWSLASFVPARALGIPVVPDIGPTPSAFSYLTETSSRHTYVLATGA